jgi:hypothetical protein
MSFAQQMQAVATQLLSKFDEREGDDRIMLKRPGARVFDVGLGEYVFGKPTLIPLVGVATNYNESMVDGTAIQAGDVKLVVTSAEEPTNDDKVILDGTEYSIVLPQPMAYTGKEKVISYNIQIRR